RRMFAVELRTLIPPPRLRGWLSWNRQVLKVAVEPDSTFAPPPPVVAGSAAFLANVQRTNVAWAAISVTPPAIPSVVERPLRNVMRRKVTKPPRCELALR